MTERLTIVRIKLGGEKENIRVQSHSFALCKNNNGYKIPKGREGI